MGHSFFAVSQLSEMLGAAVVVAALEGKAAAQMAAVPRPGATRNGKGEPIRRARHSAADLLIYKGRESSIYILQSIQKL